MRKFTQLLFSYKGRINRKTYLLSHVCGLGGYFLLRYAFMEFAMPVRDTLHPELEYLLYSVVLIFAYQSSFRVFCEAIAAGKGFEES